MMFAPDAGLLSTHQPRSSASSSPKNAARSRLDVASFGVCGLFDYDDAAFADRHHHFRYLLFDYERVEVLDAPLGVRGCRLRDRETLCCLRDQLSHSSIPETTCGAML